MAVSLITNDGAEWLSEWVNATHAALQVDHEIIISTAPENELVLREVFAHDNTVHFSGPFPKVKWGFDYLRGHMANIKHALRYTNFTHAVWINSSNCWIRAVTSSWPGFLSNEEKTHCVPVPDTKTSAEWHWRIVASDPVVYDWANKSGINEFCVHEHEGLFGNRKDWTKVADFLSQSDILAHNPLLPLGTEGYCCGALYRYPAEEFIPMSVAHKTGANITGVGRVFWGFPNEQPRPTDIIELRKDPSKIMAKRIRRDANDPTWLECKRLL